MIGGDVLPLSLAPFVPVHPHRGDAAEERGGQIDVIDPRADVLREGQTGVVPPGVEALLGLLSLGIDPPVGVAEPPGHDVLERRPGVRVAQHPSRIGGRRVPVAGGHVEVAAEDERLFRVRAPGQVVAKRPEPLELVVPVVDPGHRLPVRHVRGDDPQARDPDVQQPRLVPRPAGGKAPGEDLRRLAGKNGDPVPGGLGVHHGAVSGRLDVQPGEGLRRGPKLLKTKNIGLVTLEQAQETGPARPDRIQVPGDDAQGDERAGS